MAPEHANNCSVHTIQVVFYTRFPKAHLRWLNYSSAALSRVVIGAPHKIFKGQFFCFSQRHWAVMPRIHPCFYPFRFFLLICTVAFGLQEQRLKLQKETRQLYALPISETCTRHHHEQQPIRAIGGHFETPENGNRHYVAVTYAISRYRAAVAYCRPRNGTVVQPSENGKRAVEGGAP